MGCSYGAIPVHRESSVHTGLGWRLDAYDLVVKLEWLLGDYRRFREIAERRMWEARREFGEEAGCSRLVGVVEDALRGR